LHVNIFTTLILLLLLQPNTNTNQHQNVDDTTSRVHCQQIRRLFHLSAESKDLPPRIEKNSNLNCLQPNTNTRQHQNVDDTTSRVHCQQIRRLFHLSAESKDIAVDACEQSHNHHETPWEIQIATKSYHMVQILSSV